MLKILTIVGARPQFIKASVLSRLWQVDPSVQEILVHTGQHYDHQLSDVFFQELGIPVPQYNLGVGSGKHGEQTGKMLIEIERVIAVEQPDIVLVYGDTNSTLAGALSAVKLHIPLAHVEAGLRSFNKKMPEEINRVLTDHCADLLFAPTDQAVSNLLREGINMEKVYQVGDIMYDVALYFGEKVSDTYLAELGIRHKEYLLLTIHRAENTDHPQYLQAIFQELIKVSKTIAIVFPVHPRTAKALQNYGLWDEVCQNLIVIPPCSYLEMVCLEKNARLIITDSGGVQKEAYFYQVPCLTLRAETEWVETVQAGCNFLLAPINFSKLAQTVDQLLSKELNGQFLPLYGDGRAGEKISDGIKQQFCR